MDTENEKQAKIKEVIKDLSKSTVFTSEQDINDYLDKFREIYINNDEVVYRHMYSDLFTTLLELKNKNIVIDGIGENLYTIYLKCDENDALKKPLKKLVDHTNLEIARINYVSNIDERIGMTGQDLQEKFNETYEIATKLKPQVDTLFEKTNSTYSEFISILGIFSGIVLVYFGGTSILGNVLSNIENTFLLKGIAIAIIVGIIVLNIIFMFLYFLAKLIHENIARTTEDLSYESFTNRLKIKYPIVFYLNFFLLFLLIFDGIIWLIYAVNEKFNLLQIIILYFQNVNQKSLVIFGMLSMLFVVDFIFVMYYIYGKLFEKETGNRIQLSFIDKTKLYRERGDWYFINHWGELEDCLKPSEGIVKLLKIKKENYISKILNIKRRLFNRYPKIIWFNIIMLIIIFIYL